jgi:hypothetical protein
LTALLRQNHFRAFEPGHEELPGEAKRARRGAFLDVS